MSSDKTDRKVRVGTFNVLNLADVGDKYYPTAKPYNQKEFDKKIAWIASQLDRMHADIVGVQEIFSKEALERAVRKSKCNRDATVHVASDPHKKPWVGLISNLELTGPPDVVPNFPNGFSLTLEGKIVPIDQFSRPVLRAVIEVFDREVVFLVSHLKSKRPMYDEDEDRRDFRIQALGTTRSLVQRAAEASALRWLIVKELAETSSPLICVGDMNDAVHSVTTDILMGDPPWFRLPVDRKRRIWDSLLYSTYDIQVRRSHRDVYYTHLFNGRHESLDHILVSQEFVYQNPERIGQVEELRVFNDHLVDEQLSGDETPRWQSDHAQVVAGISRK